MNIKTFKGGIHPDEHKELSAGKPVEEFHPAGDLVFPLNMHIGKPAKPIVKKGDPVLVGQTIAEADGFVSANIISSCSGKVKAIEKRENAARAHVMSIVIENDGLYTPIEGLGAVRSLEEVSDKEILDAVKWAGIVGMGGAGFPTHVKLVPKDPEGIDYVIANGCECEPYITSDDSLMQEKGRQIVDGMKLLLQLFPNAEGVIAIEENKPAAIKAMEGVCAGEKGVRVQVVRTKYPQGGERNLISVISGRDLRAGQLPADVGCIVDNVSTIYAVYNAVCRTTPLIRRRLSVSGDAVVNPHTLIAPIGTDVGEIVASCGIKEGVTVKKVIGGGPMMGNSMNTVHVPVAKTTNSILLLTEDEVELAELQKTACIRCGRCTHACPIHLVPQMMAVAAEKKDYASYERRYYGLDCISCGSCTYVCPAKRPLTQLFKQTKAAILAEKARARAREAK